MNKLSFIIFQSISTIFFFRKATFLPHLTLFFEIRNVVSSYQKDLAFLVSFGGSRSFYILEKS